MQSLISVIVPVYNVEKYLDKCVQSIVDQTYTNLEIILVDDGSPDNCPKICDEWEEKDSRIKVIHKENGGVSLARNMGLDIAQGEYIGFVDSDDCIEPNMYQYMIKSMNNNSVDMVECGYYIDEIEKNAEIEEKEFSDKIYSSTEIIDIVASKSKKVDGFLWCKLFKKSLIGNIRFDNEIKILEDMLFCLEYLQNARSVCILENKLYHYIRNVNSALYNFNKSHITANYAIEKMLNLNIEFNKNNLEFFEIIAISRASVYITSSYAVLKDDDQNINYARKIIKKYYPNIEKKKLTMKTKFCVFCALHCPWMYVLVKKISKF